MWGWGIYVKNQGTILKKEFITKLDQNTERNPNQQYSIGRTASPRGADEEEFDLEDEAAFLG